MSFVHRVGVGGGRVVGVGIGLNKPKHTGDTQHPSYDIITDISSKLCKSLFQNSFAGTDIREYWMVNLTGIEETVLNIVIRLNV